MAGAAPDRQLRHVSSPTRDRLLLVLQIRALGELRIAHENQTSCACIGPCRSVARALRGAERFDGSIEEIRVAALGQQSTANQG